MLNEFRHLGEGLTVIYCPDTQTKQIKRVYIDTEDFQKVDGAVKGEWKSWKREGTKFIGGIDIDRKALSLSRFIMGVNDKLSHVVNLTDNPYDLRKCNLTVIPCGDKQKSDVRNRLEVLKYKVPPLSRNNKEESQPLTKQLALEDSENIKRVKRSEVAKTLGIGTSTINYWIGRYNLSVKKDRKGYTILDDELIARLKEIKEAKETTHSTKKTEIKKEDSEKQPNPRKQDIRIMKDYKTNDYLLVEIESAGTLSEIKRFNKQQIEQLAKSFSNIFS
ncbi:MerR family transcriptional regulator [Bacillus toyonensis]|uniref:MerR family transcriptional regulator n=1 Tax=Bacillus toyonensis TaxID=155322 RepID=UPI003D255952